MSNCDRRWRLLLDRGQTLREDPSLTWSASASAFADLHNAGKMIVFPGIGYADPDLSHFTSRHYWEVGATSTSLTTGWMGRYLDHAGSRTNPFQGLSMDGQINPTLATAKNPTVAIDQPSTFGLSFAGADGEPVQRAIRSIQKLGGAQRGSHDRAIAQVASAAAEIGLVHRELSPFSAAANGGDPAAGYRSPVPYPEASTGDLPQRLAGLAAMISAGLPLRCIALTTDTQFDTHSSEAATFASGVKLVAQAVAAFQADIEARGVADRVLVHVWSEFGRRAKENGSHGTDHGAAGTSMLIGTRVNGGMIGEFASLDALDVNGNQQQNVDFRSLYCSLIEQWFDSDAGGVIKRASQFPRYQLLS